MQIDRRRITNGLAWAGAALIVAIPTADLIARQFSAVPDPQVAVVQAQPEDEAPDLPTPVAERPEPAPAAQEEPAPAPVQTAQATPSQPSGGDAVDSYLQSGRQLPSYISNGGAPAPVPATPDPTPRPAISAPPAATPQPAPVATTRPQVTPPSAAPTKIVTFPTPVSERPASVASRPPTPVITQPAANQPPLIIDRQAPVANSSAPVVTARDLEDWESGPLSEFLANRGGQGNPSPSDYDEDGFWLDQGPRGSVRSYPPAYDDDYFYPFAQ